jgi:hypothetical protein
VMAVGAHPDVEWYDVRIAGSQYQYRVIIDVKDAHSMPFRCKKCNFLPKLDHVQF